MPPQMRSYSGANDTPAPLSVATTAITDRPPDSGTDREELPSRSIGDTNGNTEDSRDHPAELVLLQGQHGQRRVQPADGAAEDGD